jgi:hypothetical protein
MSTLTNERVIVKENEIVERQLSFDNISVEPSKVRDFDAKPTTRKELIAWYMYSWAVSIFSIFFAQFFLTRYLTSFCYLG